MQYDQKSSMPAEEFNSKRKGAAPDGKWQFVMSDGYGSMSVNKSQNIIKAPTRDRSAHELISVMLGHEFSHFIQSLNQSKIKLKLYDEIGGNRRMVLAEGAAMLMQKEISEQLFGFSELPKPNYVKAMSEKNNGGNYLDSVKAYYECSLRIYFATAENMDPMVLQEKAKELLRISVRGCKRLFRTGESLEAREAVLSKSKDTVYLEQLMVMEQLKEAGLEKFALVRGLNLDSLFILLKDGFIEEDDIETLNLNFIKNIWEKIKGNFAIENKI